jgi:hypothetical protein
MKIKIIIIFNILLIYQLAFSQNNSCNSYTITEKKILWSYDTDINKKLLYTISFCKHNGLHPSKIEITKSDENDTSEIKGILKTDIGFFESVNAVTSYNYQKDNVTITSEMDEKQTTSLNWEKWFSLYRLDVIAKQLPEITFTGNTINSRAYPIVDYGTFWERNSNILPDWFRSLMPKEPIQYNATTGILKYAGKEYNINEGAGKLISISPILFQNKWVRQKTYELLKDKTQSKIEDYYIEQLFSKETSENVKFIKDGLEAGKDIRSFVLFLVKEVSLKSTNVGDAKMEGPDFKFQKQVIYDHPEIKIPNTLPFDKQFYYVVNELMIKSIMQNKNVNKTEAQRILSTNPKIEKFINPYYSSIIKQN